MSETETQNESLRQQVRASTQEEFAGALTKGTLIEMASTVGSTTEGTKKDIVAGIFAKFPAPDPALRGQSTQSNPVACVWAGAHNMFTEAGEDKPRRKDVVQACVDSGIAYYTARTQYQAWYKFTSGGENMITEKSTGLPKGLPALLGFAESEESQAEADAS